MVRHIVMWNFKGGFTTDENILNANRVKESLKH